MNGETMAHSSGSAASSHVVPVTTLAGVASLSLLLPELPLPAPSVGSSGDTRSLLFHPRVAEEAQRLLACQEDSLVAQIAASLALTSADHIEVKEQYSPINFTGVVRRSTPALLKKILACNPNVFIAKEVKNEPDVKINNVSLDPAFTTPVKGRVHVNSNIKPEGGSGVKKSVVVLNKLSVEQLKDLDSLSHKTPSNKSNNANSTSKNRISRSGREVKVSNYIDDSGSESEEEHKKPSNSFFKNREREREDKKRKADKAVKRHRPQSDDDDYDPSVEAKKQRKDVDDEDEEEEEEEGGKTTGQTPKRSPPKKTAYDKKRLERKLVPMQEKLTNEELMETGVYQRFSRTVEKIFDNVEDMDLTAEIEDEEIPQEFIIPKYELSELCSESAKLKGFGAMSIVPPERLVRLLTILEKNIQDGARVTPFIDEDDEEDDKLWLEMVTERTLRAMDASLTTMYIMTSPGMSKRIYLEDTIERCVQFAKFQLSNTVYPSFDPVYRVNSKKDGFVGNMKRKRSHTKDVRNRSILTLYNKLHELVGLLADLLAIQTLTDTTVLQLSTMGVAPFFVENVSELQLSSLRLVTKIFSKYTKHRQLLLDDILASIARLPSSKRSLRTYRLNSDEQIQMLTALVLQLIQCVVELPEEAFKPPRHKAEGDEGGKKVPLPPEVHMDKDVLVCDRYETAKRTAYSFLAVFLQKTGSKSEDIDYRPLFENFVQDLLATVNKPEWPAAELLLSLLGMLLVQKFSNKNTDVAMRVSSLDCLGVVAARLRHDAVTSQLKVDSIDQMIMEVQQEESREGPALLEVGGVSVAGGGCPVENGLPNNVDGAGKKGNKKKKSRHQSNACETPPPSDDLPQDPEEERTVFLHRVLLDWLAVNSSGDVALLHARHFYISQWYHDAYNEIKRQRGGGSPARERRAARHNKRKRKRKGGDSEEDESSEEENEEEEDGMKTLAEEALIAEVTQLVERRKALLLAKVSAFPPASAGVKVQTLQTHIDYDNAELITRYLASKRHFSQSFDMYLNRILSVLTESAIAVRTKAMKCLTMVVEADPGVLARRDMQLGVHHSFLDQSTSVREAAVDLIGKFIHSRPELLHTYYDVIAARILDTGVSVRKRVIKILKDICLECPDFPKIPEICVKMIRRVNDEEGIKKLVQEVFQNMWFTPIKERPQLDQAALLRKVNNITEVVIACKDTGLDWFEQLLQSMFRPKEDKEDVTKVHTEPPKALVTACQQIVDCLVRHILTLDESCSISNPEMALSPHSLQPRTTSERLLACLKTLYLFAKIRPQLLVDHASTLQPYLSTKCQTQGDYTIIGYVAKTLELAVPLMIHPSETFLAQLEEDAVRLVLLHDRTVITSCLALLGSIVNNVTRNFSLIKDCFNKYYSFIVEYQKIHEENLNHAQLEKLTPFFRRSLYTVGLLLRHFDLTLEEVRCGLPGSITEQVFDHLMYFMESQRSNNNLRHVTLQALGSVCVRHYEFMVGQRLQGLYLRMLMDTATEGLQLRIQTLQNLELYLQEEEIRMIKQDQEWSKLKNKENLKEMCDIQSGMASAIIQIYLSQILECIVASSVIVRHSALRVIQLVLSQGLVHPITIVPYLVCMSTDAEEPIAHAADRQLQDIEKKYPGFTSMKAMQGFRYSYRLQVLIQLTLPTRGFRIKDGEQPGALNGFLYSLMRTTKQHRRAVAVSLLKQFEEYSRATLNELLFIADNLAYFPYQVIDEPLFIIHNIDTMISVTGSNLLQSFREALLPPPNVEVKYNAETGRAEYLDDDEDEDFQAIYDRLPGNPMPLVECMNSSQGCLLLLMLKEHLKNIYGITDSKIQNYSAADTTKQYEKNASRKSTAKFNPKTTLQRLKNEMVASEGNMLTDEQKKDLIDQYFDFKALMMKLDTDEDDDEDGTAGGVVHLLPGTHDSWREKAVGLNSIPAAATTLLVNHTLTEPQAVVKPLKIRASQLATRRSHHRKRRSSSHKKHKKKKKKKKRHSDSDEDSDGGESDPDWA